jgi:hypothetical protein
VKRFCPSFLFYFFNLFFSDSINKSSTTQRCGAEIRMGKGELTFRGNFEQSLRTVRDFLFYRMPVARGAGTFRLEAG